ncbi:CD83 antigen-like [Periophthalmus magnuspinnatus]|uniref:CD83 antigen-like n=1 Tax=Periophthalmus magnuspinnatus TaxID=409849 RepID=UPI00145BF51B|nr:CD83 antigen-like [Periophthalmus magnuspinnatus]
MIQTGLILYLSITTVTAAIQEIQASQDQNVSLPCTAALKPNLSYWAVRWYKETGVPHLSGLVSKTLPDGQMRWYVDADMRVSLEEGTLNLRLPTVTCSDQAVYQCYLAAPVGEQNRKGRVRLSVTGCPSLQSTEPVVPEAPKVSVISVFACVLLLVVLGSALTLFCLKKNQWNNPKKPIDHPLYPDLSPRLEKQKCIFVNFIFPPYSKICTSKFTHV